MDYKKLTISILVFILIAGAAGVLINTLPASGAQSRTVQDVSSWQQVNSNGFGDPLAGEVSALAAFNGYLYAGIHSDANDARIYRSSNGVNWNPVIEPGFGISHDIAPRAILDFIVFNNQLYTSTGRGGNPGQIYRTLNGTSWAPMVIYGFNDQDNVDISAFAVYDGMIYAGVTNSVTGAQIWRSYTGDNNTWAQVAPETPGTAAAAITAFAEFDGALYAAVESESPAQIWQSYGGAFQNWTTVVSDGFGDSNTTKTGGMAVFGGYLYVGAGNTADGAQLWRTNNGTDWAQAITPGFGDSNNAKVESVFVFQNQLYVSVKNTVTGIEIWRLTNGMLWEQANLDGFEDSHNSGSNWSNATEAFLGQLYIGTSNSVTGGELWRMQTIVADLALSKVDAVDPVTLGDSIHYTLTTSNAGPDIAQNVVLTDTLPTGVSYVSAMPDQGTCSESAGIVTCNLGNIANGGQSVVQLVGMTHGTGLLTNQANVSSNTFDPNTDNNASSETTQVNPSDLIYNKIFLPLELSASH